MTLPHLLLASIAGYLALHFFLVPRAKEHWRADRTASVVGKAVTVAVLSQMETIALMATAAGLLALIVTGAVSAFAGIPRADYATALTMVGGLRKGLGWLSQSLSTWLVLLLSLTLVYLARRRGKQTMQEIYEDSLRSELARLQADAEAGNWEPLPATQEMQQVEAQFVAVQEALEKIPPEAPDRDARAAAGQQIVQQLQQLWMRLDWSRRLQPKWETDEQVPPATTRWDRLRNLLMSKGMFRTVRDASSGLARAAMILLFLSLFGLQATQLRATTDSAVVKLTQLVVAKNSEAAIASARAVQPSQEPANDEVIDEVARRFEQAFANSAELRSALRLGSEALISQIELRRLAVRRRILDYASSAPTPVDTRQGARRAEHLAQHPSLDKAQDLQPHQKEALALMESATDQPRKPRTSFGRDMARAIRESRLTDTGPWAKLQAEVLERRAQFGQLASLGDVGGEMVAEALGKIADGVLPEYGGEVGKLVGKLQGKVPAAAIKAMHEIKRDAFLKDIASGVDVHGAIQRVLQVDPRHTAVTTAHRTALQDAFREVPTAEDIVPTVERRRPRLRWESAGGDERELGQTLAAVQEARDPRNYSRVSALADNFATYEDFFPAQSGVLERTARSRVLSQFASAVDHSAMGARVAAMVRQEVSVGDALVSLASNARGLAGFFRVGGVIIGQDPQGQATQGFRDIGWRREGDRIALWLVAVNGSKLSLGTYPAATVHQALAYAADDRRVAVTMISAADSRRRGLKVLLHPSLVDTPLGLDIIEIDRFVDTYVHNDEDPRPSPAMTRVRAATRRADRARLLYEVAREYRLSAGKLTDEERRHLAAALEELESDAALQAAVAVALADTTAIGDSTLSPLTVKTRFYDITLVNAMRLCARTPRASMTTFGTCIRQRFAQTGGDTERWWAPAPDAEEWSGVREEAFSPDVGLAFLQPDTPTAPMRFMLQIAFASPPSFGEDPESAGMPVVSDSTPWEFPSVAGLVHQEVSRRAPHDPARSPVLRRVQEFVLVQRLARTAIAGGLGEDFPVERFIALARETQGAVTRVQTPRWNWEQHERVSY